MADLEAHTVYSNGYTRSSPAVKSFWKVSANQASQCSLSSLLCYPSIMQLPMPAGLNHRLPCKLA